MNKYRSIVAPMGSNSFDVLSGIDWLNDCCLLEWFRLHQMFLGDGNKRWNNKCFKY